jgi:hypothetical protein
MNESSNSIVNDFETMSPRQFSARYSVDDIKDAIEQLVIEY